MEFCLQFVKVKNKEYKELCTYYIVDTTTQMVILFTPMGYWIYIYASCIFINLFYLMIIIGNC